jgi:hypothetical protein
MGISGNNARQQLRLSFTILCNLCKFTWPLRPFSKEGMSKPSFFPQPPGTIFLTGPDGVVYEVPEEVAKEYRVTPDRVAELGHLALTVNSSANEPEVVGHHFVVNADGVYGPHTDVLLGTAIASDGRYYTGWHRHPQGTELAIFENQQDIPLV